MLNHEIDLEDKQKEAYRNRTKKNPDENQFCFFIKFPREKFSANIYISELL